jgi:hypothetical protein
MTTQTMAAHTKAQEVKNNEKDDQGNEDSH